MGRWNSVGATSPLWVPGVLLVLGGLALIWAARKEIRRG